MKIQTKSLHLFFTTLIVSVVALLPMCIPVDYLCINFVPTNYTFVGTVVKMVYIYGALMLLFHYIYNFLKRYCDYAKV